MELLDYLEESVARKASDIFIITKFTCPGRTLPQIGLSRANWWC